MYYVCGNDRSELCGREGAVRTVWEGGSCQNCVEGRELSDLCGGDEAVRTVWEGVR